MQPARDERGRNRDPSGREIANCRAHLAAEIAMVKPRVIVCLGRMAWREIAGADEAFDPRRPAVCERAGAIVYPMYHPGYVIRGAYSERRYTRDFKRLRKLMTAAEFLPTHSFAGEGISESSALIVARSNRHAHCLRRRIAH